MGWQDGPRQFALKLGERAETEATLHNIAQRVNTIGGGRPSQCNRASWLLRRSAPQVGIIIAHDPRGVGGNLAGISAGAGALESTRDHFGS